MALDRKSQLDEEKKSNMSEKPENEVKKESQQNRFAYMFPIGVGAGVAIGVALGNIGVGLAIGAAMGVIMGLAGSQLDAKKDE